MKTNLAVLPFFIPLVTALLFLVSKTKMLRNTIAMISSLVQVFVSFIVLSALKTQDLIFFTVRWMESSVWNYHYNRPY